MTYTGNHQSAAQRFVRLCTINALNYVIDLTIEAICFFLNPFANYIKPALRLKANYCRVSLGLKSVNDFSATEQNNIMLRSILDNNPTVLEAFAQKKTIKISNQFDGSLFYFFPNISDKICSVLADNITKDDYIYFVLLFNEQSLKEREFTKLLLERFGVIDITLEANFKSNLDHRMENYGYFKNTIPYDYLLGQRFTNSSILYRIRNIQTFEDRYNTIQTIMHKKTFPLCKVAALCFTRKHLLQDQHVFQLIFERILNTTPFQHWKELHKSLD